MSASLHTAVPSAANPLDILEQIVLANDWVFDRRTDEEMAAEAPGKWCDYGLFFNWSHEISAMHFTCSFDLKVPEKRRAALYELLALANERLWIGHFGMEAEDGMPVFRHPVLLGAAARGGGGAAACLPVRSLALVCGGVRGGGGRGGGPSGGRSGQARLRAGL